MLLPDVNVLVSALRQDTEHHEAAVAWLNVASSVGMALCQPVVSGFVRVATHPRIFAKPTPPDVVWAWLRVATMAPGHRWLAAGPRHVGLLEGLCRDADARGNLVSDAAIAAIAQEHGCEVVTFDRDFARFEGLRWSTP